jgi:hypothetical protein
VFELRCMITITDNFLDESLYLALGTTSMKFSEVHWIGRNAKSENAFHDLVHKIFYKFYHELDHSSISSATAVQWHQDISGATAWWNIRPKDPLPHSDLVSYCTSGGVDYTPPNPPMGTFSSRLFLL